MITGKKRNLRTILLLLTGSFLASHLCFWLLPELFQVWNDRAIDQLFVFRSNSSYFRPGYDETIVHVDLNNTSVQQLNAFYTFHLKRSNHAQVVRNLAAMKVSAQLYDFIFAARLDESEDEAFIDAASEADNVYFGVAFDLLNVNDVDREEMEKGGPEYLHRTKWHVTCQGRPEKFFVGANPLMTFPALASASRGLGYLNLKFDRDGVFRRLPLLVRYGGAFYPSFSFRAICDYLGVTPDRIIVKPGKTITLKAAKRPQDSTPTDILIPIDARAQMLINFIGPWERMKHYNLVDVFRASWDRDDMAVWKEELSGKIVVISETSTGSIDVGPVPTDTHFPLSGVHANAMHTILTGSFLRELSCLEMLCIEGPLMLIILALSLRFSSIPFCVATFATAASYAFLVGYFFLHESVVLHMVRPLLMVAFALTAVVAYRYMNEEKEKVVLRKTFEAYFPPPIVKKIVADPKRIASGGQKKELTILFSDIRSFTHYASTMSPDHIQKLLNEYFELMTEIVFKYQGTVDKFIGDGLMVFFGDPEPQPDHALRCVRAAMDMQKEVRKLRARWEKQGDMPIQIRIGINTGDVVVGNMGSSRRLSYTVLGSAVNLAQRLESNAPAEGILISQRTYNLVRDLIPTGPPRKIQIKGFDAPVAVYDVITQSSTNPIGTKPPFPL